jgi:hypothetical protein
MDLTTNEHIKIEQSRMSTENQENIMSKWMTMKPYFLQVKSKEMR